MANLLHRTVLHGGLLRQPDRRLLQLAWTVDLHFLLQAGCGPLPLLWNIRCPQLSQRDPVSRLALRLPPLHRSVGILPSRPLGPSKCLNAESAARRSVTS